MGISQKIKDRMESGENYRWIPMKRYNTKTVASLRYLIREWEKNQATEDDLKYALDAEADIHDCIAAIVKKNQEDLESEIEPYVRMIVKIQKGKEKLCQ